MSFINKTFKSYQIHELISEVFYVFFGYFLLIFSYIVPRNKSKWVFGNKKDFKDNTKYLYLYLLENNKEINPIWITSSHKLVKQMRTHSYPVYHKYSIKGLYHSLTAGVYVSTVNSNHINYFTSGGAFKVYLWHGIALKKMSGAKASPRDGSFLSKITMPYTYEKVDFFLSTTPMIDEQFLENFNLSANNLYSGMYPRCSFMLSDKSQLLNYIEKYEDPMMLSVIHKIKDYDKVYLYMPTWRLNYGKKFIDYALTNLYALNETLKKNKSILLLKLHPTMKYDSFKYKDLTHIIYIDATVDMYPILPFTDILISDYSSIYYDYLLLDNKGVILYDFDVDTYVNSEYGLFRDYKEYTPGTHVPDFESLLKVLDAGEDCLIPEQKRNWILHEMWGNYEGKSPKDLVCAIKKKVHK